MAARVKRNNKAAILKRIENATEAELKIAAFETSADAKIAVLTGTRSGRTYRLKSTTVSGGSRNTEKFAGMEMGRTKAGRFTPGLKRDKDGRIINGAKIHRASADGEAPANETGNLANSIEVVKLRALTWLVGVGAEYGAVLEIALNRPFLYPAYRKAAAKLLRGIRRRLRGGGYG